MRWLCFVVLMSILVSCHSTTQSNYDHDRSHIALSKDSQMVVIRGLDYAVLQELKRDSLPPDAFKSLFPVYRMPADTDMKDDQNEQPGVYQITDSLITFKPDTAFKKRQTYFARFYGHSTGNTPASLSQGKGNLKSPKFTEVVFKF